MEVLMPRRMKNYMVDQFGEELRIGQCYGVHLSGNQTRATVWMVVEFIRDTLVLAEVDTTKPRVMDPKNPRPDGWPSMTGTLNRYTNLTAGLLCFVRLDSEYREVAKLAQPAKAERAKNLRHGLGLIAKQAKRLRAKQDLLIQEVALALEGASDPSDVGDMAACFVRDDVSDVTIDKLVRLYSESLERSEVEE
jgi:hypothetical protein